MNKNDRRADETKASNSVENTTSEQVSEASQPAATATAAVDRVERKADESADVSIGSSTNTNTNSTDAGIDTAETSQASTDATATDRTSIDAAETGQASTDTQWIVVLCGLPGVGKSTVAAHVMEQIDATRLRTDVIRKELFDEPQYTTSETNTVYQTLYDRAEALLAEGNSVVLDATFAKSRYRIPVQDIATDHGVQLRLIRVVCKQSVVEKRIASRDDISDADFTVHRQFKDTFEPLESEHATVDNSSARCDTRDQVEQLF